jgi:hypothetical protein
MPCIQDDGHTVSASSSLSSETTALCRAIAMRELQQSVCKRPSLANNAIKKKVRSKINKAVAFDKSTTWWQRAQVFESTVLLRNNWSRVYGETGIWMGSETCLSQLASPEARIAANTAMPVPITHSTAEARNRPCTRVLAQDVECFWLHEPFYATRFDPAGKLFCTRGTPKDPRRGSPKTMPTTGDLTKSSRANFRSRDSCMDFLRSSRNELTAAIRTHARTGVLINLYPPGEAVSSPKQKWYATLDGRACITFVPKPSRLYQVEFIDRDGTEESQDAHQALVKSHVSMLIPAKTTTLETARARLETRLPEVAAMLQQRQDSQLEKGRNSATKKASSPEKSKSPKKSSPVKPLPTQNLSTPPASPARPRSRHHSPPSDNDDCPKKSDVTPRGRQLKRQKYPTLSPKYTAIQPHLQGQVMYRSSDQAAGDTAGAKSKKTKKRVQRPAQIPYWEEESMRCVRREISP